MAIRNGQPRGNAATCVVCSVDRVADLEEIAIGGRARLACRAHAELARRTRARSIAALERAAAPAAVVTTDRRAGERRFGDERRAFWRPTPDRRHEATELGRRAADRARSS